MTTYDEAHDRVRRAYELAFEPGTGRVALAADPHLVAGEHRVLVTGTLLRSLEADAHTRICLADANGLRVLTDEEPGNHRHGRWSPDGTRIAYLSDADRPGVPQLRLLDTATANSSSTPTVEALGESLTWAPDGSAILMVSAGLDADLGDTQGPGDTSRGWAAWQPSIRSTSSAGRRRGIWIHDLSTGTTRSLDAPTGTVWEAAWCGSDTAVAVVSRAWGEGAWFDSELHAISVRTGERSILHRGRLQLGRPTANRSGTWAAVIEGLASDRGNVAGRLMVLDLATRQARSVDTDGVDVTDTGWIDEQTIGFVGLRGTHTVAGSVCVTDRAQCRVVWDDAGSCGRHVPAASFATGGAMAVVRDSFTEYPAVLVLDTDGAEVMTASLRSASTDQLARAGSAEEVTWDAPDGRTVNGILCLPTGPAPHPLVLHVHGGPVGANTSAWHMQNDTTRHLVAAGYAVLHPNPRGSHGRGAEFSALVVGDMAGADTADVVTGVQEMVRRGIADPDRIGVAGTSYGGYLANWLPAHSDLFRAAVAMSPVTDWHSMFYTSNIPQFVARFMGGSPEHLRHEYADRSPMSVVDRIDTPTLEVAGARDLCTPSEQAVRFHNALAMRGVETELVIYPDEGHGTNGIPTTMDLCARVLAWFERHLGPTAPSPGTVGSVRLRQDETK